jgi:hypothetical protein
MTSLAFLISKSQPFDLYDQQSTKQGSSNVVLMVGRETEFELAARPDAAVEA